MTRKDFRGSGRRNTTQLIASMVETGLVLLLHPSLEVQNVQDLVAMAKAEPGEVLCPLDCPADGERLCTAKVSFITARWRSMDFSLSSGHLLVLPGGRASTYSRSEVVISGTVTPDATSQSARNRRKMRVPR